MDVPDDARDINRSMVERILSEPDPDADVAEGGFRLRVLQSTGRRSGVARRTPTAVVRHRGRDYLVSPDPTRDWVRNLHADPDATLLGGGPTREVRAVPTDDGEGAAVVSTYLAAMTVPWALRAFPVGPEASRDEVLGHMSGIAVFRLEGAGTTAPNAEQRARWNGPSGSAWSEYAEHFERGYAAFDAAYLSAVAAGPDDLVLDVGSGPGALALEIAATARRVVGVDVSAPLVDLARRRAQAAGRDDAVFVVADAQVDPLPDEGPFDVVVSHFGSMFFDDPVTAFTALYRSLRPQGRLVLLTWQGPERNPWQVEVLRALHPDQEAPIPPIDGPSPFGLSDPGRVRAVLGAAGFVDVDLEDLRAPHWSGADPDDAVRFTATHNAAVLDSYDEATRRRALDRLRAVFEAHHTPDGVLFDSATWLVRAHRP